MITTESIITNETLVENYLLENESTLDTNHSNSETELKIEFEFIEIYVIVIQFVLSFISNTIICLSIISANHSQDMSTRRAVRLPVVDLILLILSITTILRLLIRSGLQVLCLSGICIIGVPLCQFHGFFNSLLQYVYLWTLAQLIQDRYIKFRAQHDYTSKCSSLIVIVTLVGVIFAASVHVCGPIWGFSNYKFIRDEITCSVDWKSEYSCSYLIFSVLLISSPAHLTLILWTVMLIHKIIKRRYFTRADRRKSKESPMIAVSLTSSLASSSIATLSKSLVLNESYENLTVILMSVTFLATSAPKSLLDTALGCTAMVTNQSLVFWSSIVNEIGSTLMVPNLLLLFHPKLRSSFGSLMRLGFNLRDDSHQRETIYLSTRPSTSLASTSNTAVTGL